MNGNGNDGSGSLQCTALTLLLLGLLALGGVRLDAVQEVSAASALVDVLDADVDALLDDTVAHNLVHLHADGALRHVPHHTGLAVVELGRHALVHARVGIDIHKVTCRRTIV